MLFTHYRDAMADVIQVASGGRGSIVLETRMDQDEQEQQEEPNRQENVYEELDQTVAKRVVSPHCADGGHYMVPHTLQDEAIPEEADNHPPTEQEERNMPNTRSSTQRKKSKKQN